MSEWPFKTLGRRQISRVFDDYHEGVFILDREARFVYYNERISRMDGYAREEVLGRAFTDIYNLTEQDSVSLACLATGRPAKKGLYYRTKAGTIVNAFCNTYPIFEEGRLAGALCFTLDFNLASLYLEELVRTGRLAGDDSASPGPPPPDAPYTFSHLVGQSAAFVKAAEKAREAARHHLPIMLVGETGTGKELFAQAIHNHKPGRSRRFMAVNCPAIPENLLESLLFGTTRGAFTGAVDKAGLFEAARGGTVFLDEINSMSLDLQSKLLRVLQEKKVSRVGSTREVEVDCRIVSATSHNPYAEISARRLRPDLFYRLGAVLIHIPPLREREGDLGLLAGHFVKKHQAVLESRTKGLTPEALAWLKRQAWPGTVRELEYAVASAMVFAKGESYLKIENFSTLGRFAEAAPPVAVAGPPAPPGPGQATAAPWPGDDRRDAGPAASALSPDETIPFFFSALPAETETGAEIETVPDWEDLLRRQQTKERREELEKEMICGILEKTGGHKAAAAAILGLSPQLLHSKLKKYSIKYVTAENPDEREAILRTLARTGGHKSAAAALLGMSRQLLHSKMKKYGLLDDGRRS